MNPQTGTCERGGVFSVDIANPAAPKQLAFRSALPGNYHGEGAHVVTFPDGATSWPPTMSSARRMAFDAADKHRSCRADDGSVVRFPGSAIAASDDEQAARYASTHATGDDEPAANEPERADTGGKNIPNSYNGTGYRVRCANGMYSHSGGRPGACSGARRRRVIDRS